MGFKLTKNTIPELHKEVLQNLYENQKMALTSTMYELIGYAKRGLYMPKNFTDRTTNLRSSIGFVIFYNGELIESSFKSSTEIESHSKKFAESLLENDNTGFVCVLVAGMNYAAYVESKGYSVITGPHLEFNRVLLENLQNIQKK